MSDPVQRAPWRRTATVAADGTATIAMDQVPSGFDWLVDYVVVSCSDPNAVGVAALYESVADFAHFLDGAPANARAVASYSPARVIPGGETLLCKWSGLTPGVVVALRVEYREAVAGG